MMILGVCGSPPAQRDPAALRHFDAAVEGDMQRVGGAYRLCHDAVPGMGTIQGCWAISHDRAICAGVAH